MKNVSLKMWMLGLIVTMIVTSTPATGYATVAFGNPNGLSPIPLEAQAEDVSNPDHIIGTGTPESCTGKAFIEAVAKGGTIVFNGGNEPFTITLDEPAKIFNNAVPDVVIDGGGLVTLSGGDKTRILYMNTCDPNQVWTTNHCQNQESPRLTVQNITFANGNSKNDTEHDGGGAIWVRGGRFKVFNCRFINNVCASTGPDVGGGAIRVFDQYNDLPVYVVNSTFGGGEGLGNVGSNGGAISSIGVSWTLINCVFSHNEAIGNGGNPAKAGSVGGGSGGAIYNDGNEMTLTLSGTKVENNKVNAYGSGIFFVTNNHTGDIVLENSLVENNIGGSWYPKYPNISMHADTKVTITNKPVEAETVPENMTKPSLAKVHVDGEKIDFEAYNIDGYTYFKLRDIAQSLNGSDKQFEILWNSTLQAITILPDSKYTSTGTELVLTRSSDMQAYIKVSPNILINDQRINLSAYRINDYTYFKLRDLGDVINFDVNWNQVEQRIEISTK